jgi:hypothetical protein
MHKLIDGGACLKQRLDHQTVLALVPVRRLNQTLDFGPVQPLHRSFPGSRRFKAELAAGFFDDLLRLIIPEMVFPPQAECFLNDGRKRLRFRFLTPHFARSGGLWTPITPPPGGIFAQ